MELSNKFWSDDEICNQNITFSLFYQIKTNLYLSTVKSLVLFQSLRNSKRRNKVNFTSKSNSNKKKLCGGGGQYFLVLNKISTLKFHLLSLFTICK